MQTSSRVFEDKPATRERVPLLVGLMGASSSGKTFSALRLAAGIQRVSGGDVFVIDSEAKRALHYADKFKFRHVPFGAPFGSIDYLAAIEHCIKKGAGVIVVDSASHEHEGPGGVLEQHEAELTRIAGDDWKKRERCTMLAWQKPKSDRRRMINSIVQMQANFVFCFRAKEKIKIVRGQEPQPLGFMPIAGDEFIYEMTVNCLLMPGSCGVPTWQSGEVGERGMMKLPIQFQALFSNGVALSEETGQRMAEWAAGDMAPELDPQRLPVLLAAIEMAPDLAALKTLLANTKGPWSDDEKRAITSAKDTRKNDLEKM